MNVEWCRGRVQESFDCSEICPLRPYRGVAVSFPCLHTCSRHGDPTTRCNGGPLCEGDVKFCNLGERRSPHDPLPPEVPFGGGVVDCVFGHVGMNCFQNRCDYQMSVDNCGMHSSVVAHAHRDGSGL